MRHARLGVGLLALALLGLGAGALLLRRPAPAVPPPPPASAASPRRCVAVLGFKNLSGPDAAWLSTALSEMLTAELRAGEKLRMIPGETVARMKADLALADTDTLAKEALGRIRKHLGADLVVLGTCSAGGKSAGGAVHFDVRLEDAATGERVAAVTESGTEPELPDLVSRAGARLREALGVGGISAAEAGGVRAALPSKPEAARLYAEGLGRLRAFDALAACELLQKAVAADPTAPLAHSALAAAWSALGYDAKAQDEAKRALDLSAPLARGERLVVEARHGEAAKDWEKAIETYRTLRGLFPDEVEYGLRLAQAQTAAGKGKDALATVDALRTLPRPASEDPRIDLTEAQAAEALSEFKRCQAIAARAAERGAALGARLLAAQARVLEGRAFLRLGKPDRATASCQEARRIFAEVGDRAGVAQALNLFGAVLSEKGEPDRARAVYEEALAISRGIGDRFGEAWELSTIAILLQEQGDLAGAKAMYEESLTIKRQIGDTRGVAVLLNNMANVLTQQGDLATAKAMYMESLAIARGIGDKDNAAWPLGNLADVLRLEGDLAGATARYDEALALRRAIGHESGAAYCLHGLGDVLLARGDLAAARKRYEEALAIRTELGEKGTAASTRVALAVLSLEEGHASEAEALARGAAEEFRKERLPDREAAARAAVARSLLEQGKLAEARAEVREALVASNKSQNLLLRVSVAVTGARVRARGEPAKAFRGLQTCESEATRSGLVGLQYEARLAMGEIDVFFGDDAAGRARLKALEGEASAKGFALIARKARKALS